MKEMKPLDMKDTAIIDAFPVYDCNKTVLNIGCGDGRIDFHLAKMGYRICAVDTKKYDTWVNSKNLTFHVADIFDLSNIPVETADVVICSQVLEHLNGYKAALVNLLALTGMRLIITIPYRNSFKSPGHRHHWNDREEGRYKDIHEFINLCLPYSVAISKIRTKPKDVGTNKYDYLIIIDKRQNIMSEGML